MIFFEFEMKLDSFLHVYIFKHFSSFNTVLITYTVQNLETV